MATKFWENCLKIAVSNTLVLSMHTAELCLRVLLYYFSEYI